MQIESIGLLREYEIDRGEYIFTPLLGSLLLSYPDRFFSLAKGNTSLVKMYSFSAERENEQMTDSADTTTTTTKIGVIFSKFTQSI